MISVTGTKGEMAAEKQCNADYVKKGSHAGTTRQRGFLQEGSGQDRTDSTLILGNFASLSPGPNAHHLIYLITWRNLQLEFRI